jgi:hypothetical protein
MTLAEDSLITSLLHKQSGPEALERGGNWLLAYPTDKLHNWITWNVESHYAKGVKRLPAFDSIVLIDTGLHYTANHIRCRWGHWTVMQMLLLGANARHLNIRHEPDWQGR